jgi:hypothetical protein
MYPVLLNSNVIINMIKISKLVFSLQWRTYFRKTLFITLHNTVFFVSLISIKFLCCKNNSAIGIATILFH